MPNLGQICRLVILVVAGLALTTLVDLPVWTLPLIVLDSPLTLRFSSPWLVAAVLAILACSGTDVLLRSSPEMADAGFRQTTPAWALPGIIAAASPLLIAKFEPLSLAWLLVLAGAGLSLTLALLAEIHAIHPGDQHRHLARVGVPALCYILALVTFTGIYSAHARTILSGTGTFFVAFVLTVSLLRWSAGPHVRAWPYAMLTALIVGLTTWGLNHLALETVAGGGLLLLVFYLVSGLVQQFIQRALTWRVLVEFAIVVGLGLLLLIGFSGRGG